MHHLSQDCLLFMSHPKEEKGRKMPWLISLIAIYSAIESNCYLTRAKVRCQIFLHTQCFPRVPTAGQNVEAGQLLCWNGQLLELPSENTDTSLRDTAVRWGPFILSQFEFPDIMAQIWRVLCEILSKMRKLFLAATRIWFLQKYA